MNTSLNKISSIEDITALNNKYKPLVKLGLDTSDLGSNP